MENPQESENQVRIYSEDKDGNLTDTTVPSAASDIKDEVTFLKALAGDDAARKIVTEQLGIDLFK
jgi:hypothetical protein